VKAAQIIFWSAAIWGFVVLIPGLFGEAALGVAMPPAITHPEFYYGFYGVALVFQLIFVMIARDPERYGALIPIAILEKCAFFAPTLWLYHQGRVSVGGPFYGAMIDGVWMLLFAFAWWKNRA